MQDKDLAAKATALTKRFRAAGINAEPGLGGSVIIYASDIEAEAMLAALEVARTPGDPLIRLGLSAEKAAAARDAADAQAAHEDQTRPLWATRHPDASANQYGYAPDESGSAEPGQPEAVPVYRIALLFSAIASADATLREAMEPIVEDLPTAPRIIARWLAGGQS
jgi:hypothetical protein